METTAIDIHIKKAEPEDREFAFSVKKNAMLLHIKKKWGWNEQFQRELHQVRWSEKPWYLIIFEGIKIGTVSLHELEGNILRFGEFYILEQYRNKGIGAALLKQVLEEADKSKKVVIQGLLTLIKRILLPPKFRYQGVRSVVWLFQMSDKQRRERDFGGNP